MGKNADGMWDVGIVGRVFAGHAASKPPPRIAGCVPGTRRSIRKKGAKTRPTPQAAENRPKLRRNLLCFTMLRVLPQVTVSPTSTDPDGGEHILSFSQISWTFDPCFLPIWQEREP